MQPNQNDLIITKLETLTLACQQSLIDDNIEELNSLLQTRKELIDRIAAASLSPQQIKSLHIINAKTSQLETQLARVIQAERASSRRDQQAIVSVRQFVPNQETSSYELQS